MTDHANADVGATSESVEEPQDGSGYSVDGTVTDGDGEPMAGATVVAFDCGVRDQRELGRAVTDDAGAYGIEYGAAQLGPGRSAADLKLEVSTKSGTLLLTSPITFNAPRRATIALALGGDTHAQPSEYTALTTVVTSTIGALSPLDLQENVEHQDLTFLAGQTGIELERLALWAAAQRLAAETKLPAELFYGLFRSGVPADAATTALAVSGDGVDLDANARQLLDGVLTAASTSVGAAVSAAARANVVPASYAQRAPKDLAKLGQRSTQAVLDSTLGAVLDLLSLDSPAKARFVRRYGATVRAARATFWSDLAKDKSFSAAQVENLRFAFAVAQLTNGHLPLIRELVAQHAAGKLIAARDLARLTAADWRALLEASGGQPIGDGVTPDAYAAMLERSFTQAYPTPAFSARVAADPQTPFADAAATGAFLDANPSFDLRYTNVDAFAQKTTIDAGVRATLLAAQRLLKLNGDYSVIRALHADGVHSAQQVYAMGRDSFVAKYAQLPALGETEAASMWARAEQTYAMAVALATRYNATLSAASPVAVPEVLPADVDEQIAAFPNLQTLFGSDSTCACQDCESVLGAGAYLVDMLEFLGHRSANGGGSVRDVLLARRPDLAQIELSCPNTNIELPYIDLVNELLEDAVAPPPDATAAARGRQTTLATPELNANPEHVNAQAYATLAGAVYPWALPFDLELAETRTYLGALSLSRAGLIQTFRNPDGDPSLQAQLARERLGFSALEADLVTGGPLAAGLDSWDYWGLAETGNSIVDPSDPTATISGGWIEILAHARVLLARAGLEYRELAQLLNTNFVNGGGAVSISPEPPDSCDVATMTISGLSQDTLDRVHRFVRLQRHLGWDPYELDDAIANLQADTPAGLPRLNDLLLRQLAAVTAAASRYSLSVAEAVALLAPIATRDVPTLPGDERRYSLYHDLFENLTILNPPDPAFALDAQANLIAASTTPPPTLAEHRPALVAALELADADLELAIASLTDGLLTLPNLSTLYRSTRLARALGVTIRELLTLLAIVEAPTDASPHYEAVAPFDGTRPGSLATFVALLAELKESGLTIAEADYIARGIDDGIVAPDPVAVGTTLLGIHKGLAGIAAEQRFAPDPTGADTRKELGRLLAAADVDTAMAILDGSSTLSEPDQAAFVAATLSPYVPASAPTELVGATALTAGQPRFEYVLQSLLVYEIRTQSSGLIVHTLAQSLAATTATTALLLKEWLPSFTGTGRLIEDFLALASATVADPLAPISPDEPAFEPYFTAYATLAKIALVVTTLRFSSDDVNWWRNTGVAAGWLDPTALPTAPQVTASGRFHRLLRLARARKCRDGIPGKPPLAALFADVAITKSDYFARLGAVTQWPQATLTVLCGDPADTTDRGELALVYPDDYESELALSRLQPALEVVSRTGIPADVTGWIAPTLAPGAAAAIKQSAKANHAEGEWLALAKQLRDPLREAQRDSLLSYLIANPPPGVGRWVDAEDVFAHFLIDVEMDACMATSRIVQAHAAVQLFVQRCLLGIEPGVVDTAADSSWAQWQWMSRYRVWQANREIFLFPENWINPGLRSDASPFFADLENDLRQGDLDADVATKALANYLEKLEAVARLDVCGIFHDSGDGRNVLHVLARTQALPHVHYLRRWVDSSRWTPWEKVDLDITSDHVVPVVWDGKLYLFWLIVTSKPDELAQGTPPAPANPNPPLLHPSKHLEVQLAWSEYKHGKWQPKRTAKQTLVFSNFQGLPDWNPWDLTLKSSFNETTPELHVSIPWKTGSAEPRAHSGTYRPRGAGSGVDVFLHGVFWPSLTRIGGEAVRDVGLLAASMMKPQLSAPPGTVFDGDWFAGGSDAFLSATRPRIGPLEVSYISMPLVEQADSFRLVVPHQTSSFDSSLPFFYRDSAREYLAIPDGYYRHDPHVVIDPPVAIDPSLIYFFPPVTGDTAFRSFYHPFVPLLVRALEGGGTDALFAHALQHDPATAAGTVPFDFASYYQPTAAVPTPHPAESIEFARDSSYSAYNWELFFHAPFLIANALSTNQQFDAARRWYEYIFNPRGSSSESIPQRYWVTEPFFELGQPDYAAQQISTLMHEINSGDPQLESQVAAWRANPFDPDLIAQLRPVAYQRAIVTKYIDNLIAAGDRLFQQDTRESINLATQYYVLASELLGPRPELISPRVAPVAKTYADLVGALDAFSNELVAAENAIPPVNVDGPTPPGTPSLPTLTTLYFRIPPNGTLLEYWDLVADRMFKIRHCMNIEGVVQQLALFAPPLDPGSLVGMAGLDLDSLLTDAGVAVPPYRFRVMLRHALELCEQVRGHGSELLAALEKRDAETLARIRSSSERQLQAAVADARGRQVDAANQDLEVFAASQQSAADRVSFYANRPLTNPWEAAAMFLHASAVMPQIVASNLELTASAAHLAPTYQTGVAGSMSSPVATASEGGGQVGAASSAAAAQARLLAAIVQTSAELSATLGQYHQRQDEWTLQATLAQDDLARIAAETAAATIRLDVAEREKAAQDVTVQQADDLDAFLHSKFTNQELYDWMVAQTSTTYFQAYQLAYSIAKAAERCYRRELAVDTEFVKFGYWDSLKQGLTAGDKLQYDLRRLESAYFTNNERELELTKHVSLLQLDPYALVELRAHGSCVVQLPELLFDLDNPGHYLRRLKSVALTLPCVVGPYTTLSLTLTLLDNHVRISNDIGGGYPRTGSGDTRFTDYPGGVEEIVTSSGQNDDGLFELRLDDDRYLPFENAGAVSTWRLSLNNVFPQFDYSTISDVVLHLRYTARDGGTAFADAVAAAAKAQLNAVALAENRKGLYRLFSARHDFASNWALFLDPAPGADQVLTLAIPPERFPFYTNGLDIQVAAIDVIATGHATSSYDVELTPPGGAAQTATLAPDSGLGGAKHAHLTFSPTLDIGQAPTPAGTTPPTFSLRLRKSGAGDWRSLASSDVENVILVLSYRVST